MTGEQYWTCPQHPLIAIQTHTREVTGGAEAVGMVLIFDDAAEQLEVPCSTVDVIVAELEHWLVPNHYSWPATPKVDIYSSHKSLSGECRLIKELFWYGSTDINLYQILNGKLLSPLNYTAQQAMELAA